jgi:hypothetical protein
MGQTLITLLTIIALTSCQDTPKSLNDNIQNIQKKTDTLIISDKDKIALPDSNEATANIFEPSLNIKDFEKVRYNFSYLSSGKNGKYFSKKGFALLADTINTATRKFTLIKSKHKEILEISYSQFPEGDNSFVINYYISSKIGYEIFIDSLKTSKFKYDKGNKRYEIFRGTYEDLCVYTNGQILKNKEMYYWIKYLHYQGKELSAPIIEGHFAKDTIK